jgi:protein pelota
VRVEKTEFKQETKTLRVSGTIQDGPQDLVSIGSHHTHNIDTDTAVTVIKEGWSRTDLDRIQDAVKSTLRPKVMVVALDEGEAALGVIREAKIEYLDLARNIGGKYDLKGRQARKHEFYRELTGLIGNVMENENVSHIILAGPGFEKKNYHGFLVENYGEIAGKCIVEDTGGGGRAGIQEVLKRDVIHRTLEEVNAVRDIRYVEDVLKHIAKDTGLAVYGLSEVADAVDAGAVEVLLVLDALFFSQRGRIEPLMNKVKAAKGRVHLVNLGGEAGQKLESLGKAAALLHYRIS